MKHSFFILSILFAAGFAQSQTSKLGIPKGWSDKFPVTTKAVIRPEKVDNQKEYEKYYASNEGDILKIGQYGTVRNTDVDFFEMAEARPCGNEATLYQLRIQSPGAKSLNVVLDQFELKEGTLLYFYDAAHTTYKGAFTSLNNNASNMLGLDLLYTDDAVIEIWEPTANKGMSKIHVSHVVHGFIHLDEMLNKSLNASGDCNIDVNCPQGAGWSLCRNAVGMIVNGTGGICTGAMVNNTAQDGKPYFLTAYHCGTASAGSWIYRFRWESPEGQAVCGTGQPSVNGPEDMNINGGVLRAANQANDFQLIELNSKPDPAWQVVYAGWDRSSSAPTSSVGIHHPNGDIKKIAVSYKPCVSTTYTSLVNGHWKVFWDEGVTEPGSSGSPLFNQDRRIVGQLNGGTSGCFSSNQSDSYGKFSLSWEGGGNSNSRLKDWLDPSNSGVMTLDADVQNSVDPFLFPKIIEFETTLCNGALNGTLILTNGGTTPLTSATITYAVDGNSPSTINWTGSLGLYESDTLDLSGAVLPGGFHVFTASVSNPNNGATDQELNNNSFSQSFLNVKDGGHYNLIMNLDCYGNETSWEITDSGLGVYHKSPIYVPDGLMQTVVHDICLNDGCYTFKIKDSNADGFTSWNCGDGSYYFTDGITGDTLFKLDPANANFGASKTTNFCVKYLGENELEKFDLKLSPNPFTQQITISSPDEAITEVLIYDVTGQLVSKDSQLNAFSYTIDNLKVNGVYYLHIQTKDHFSVYKAIKINGL